MTGRQILAAASGALFGAGLVVSDMVDTRKVHGFLDIFGAWDPTLAFVLGGAMLPMAVAWRATRGRRPVFAPQFPQPASRRIDPALIGGAVMFGAGWGLVGLCPGPALAAIGFGGWGVAVFVLAMAVGMRAVAPLRGRLDATARAA